MRQPWGFHGGYHGDIMGIFHDFLIGMMGMSCRADPLAVVAVKQLFDEVHACEFYSFRALDL